MNQPDVVEFWIGDRVVLRLESSFAPDKDDLVNISKKTYCVVGRSFTVDHADDPRMAQLRCNVIMVGARANKS